MRLLLSGRLLPRPVLLAAAFFLLCFSSSSAPGTDASAVHARVLSILTSVKERHDNYRSIRAVYHVTAYRSAYGYAQMYEVNPKDRKLFERFHASNAVHKYEYAVKGSRISERTSGPVLGRDGQVRGQTENINIFDGSLWKESQDGGKTVAITRKPERVQNPSSRCTGESLLLEIFWAMKTSNRTPTEVTIAESHEVPGASFRIGVSYVKTATAHTFWLGPEEKGYCLLRAERRCDGKLFHVYSDCHYRIVDGCYFPDKAVFQSYYDQEGIRALAETRTYELESVVLREDQIPDDLFQMPVPTPTELIDRDMGSVHVRSPADVQQHLLAAANEARNKADPSAWKLWVSVSVTVIALLGSCVAVLKVIRRRRERAGQSTSS